MSFTIRMDTSAVEKMLAELGTKVEGAARPAAQAAAQVLYEEVKRNVYRIGEKSGNLRSAIYQVYSRNHSGQGVATYHVSWNAKRAPHGHLVEFGHIQRYQTIWNKKTGRWVTLKNRPIEPRTVAARPFVRPAVAKFGVATEAMQRVLIAAVEGDGSRTP